MWRRIYFLFLALLPWTGLCLSPPAINYKHLCMHISYHQGTCASFVPRIKRLLRMGVFNTKMCSKLVFYLWEKELVGTDSSSMSWTQSRWLWMTSVCSQMKSLEPPIFVESWGYKYKQFSTIYKSNFLVLTKNILHQSCPKGSYTWFLRFLINR